MPRRRGGPNIGCLTTNQRRLKQRQNVTAATVEGPAEHKTNHVLMIKTTQDIRIFR